MGIIGFGFRPDCRQTARYVICRDNLRLAVTLDLAIGTPPISQGPALVAYSLC